MAKVVGGQWVTINGTHVFIGGNGKIQKGPAHMIGFTPKGAKAAQKASKKADSYSGKVSSYLGEGLKKENRLHTGRKDMGEISGFKASEKRLDGIRRQANKEVAENTSNKSSQAEKSPASKAMAKAKSDREADPSKKKVDGLVERAKRQTQTGYISRTDKVDTTYGSIDKIVNTSGVVSLKDIPNLKSLPKGSVQLIVQNNSSNMAQPTFAIKVGDTVMRATPKVAAAMFPDKVRGMTKAMDNLADKYSKGKAATGDTNFDNATSITKANSGRGKK